MPEAIAIDLSEVGLIGSARGYDLRGWLYDERHDDYVVLMYRPFRNLDPYVVGRVQRLTDDEWSNGRYFRNPGAATRDMVRRAGVDVE